MGYTIHQTTADTATLPTHIESLKENLKQSPEVLVADAGYGSEENYEYLENNNIEAYIKFNYFEKEHTNKWKQDPSRVENLHYYKHKDCYYCPMGQPMNFVKEKEVLSDNGFKQIKRLYQAQNCHGCPMRGPCHKGKANRMIETNPRLIRFKEKIRERLESEKGLKYRSQRPVDVEPVFGMVKNNRNYRRFLLRGLKKVEIETGLISIAHNLMKMAG